ncbi:PLS1-like protein [Mya arenaria]|uniref:Phospholipid scramblase n=1 Tax=Mya arenaria TaxID=6604 RepID=A0ABY7F020_MYAAR|nr:PLS1-like protein [Mya arenaria]
MVLHSSQVMDLLDSSRGMDLLPDNIRAMDPLPDNSQAMVSPHTASSHMVSQVMALPDRDMELLPSHMDNLDILNQVCRCRVSKLVSQLPSSGCSVLRVFLGVPQGWSTSDLFNWECIEGWSHLDETVQTGVADWGPIAAYFMITPSLCSLFKMFSSLHFMSVSNIKSCPKSLICVQDSAVDHNEVVRVTREFKCCAGCPWCACTEGLAHEVVVESPPGTVVGYVLQQQSCIEPKYAIMNASREEILTIKGPMCVISGPCCPDVEFIIHSKDGTTEVGKISKQWSGAVREYFTDADNFGVSFPMDLDVKMKATMIGAVFLIDFMYFEQSGNQNRNNHY